MRCGLRIVNVALCVGCGVAAVCCCLAVAGCTRDGFLTAEEGVERAERVLGVTIDPGQDWLMSATVTADLTVTLELDQSYTVVVYDENPLYNEQAVYYLKTTVGEGVPQRAVFSVPAARSRLYVAVFDSRLRRMVSVVDVVDGHFALSLGGGGTRAAESEGMYADFVRTVDDYLSVREWTVDLGNEWWHNYVTYEGCELNVADMKEYTALTDDMIVNGTVNGEHYRVAAGTEVTKVFNMNARQGKLNDAVIYVEGRLHLNGNALNGPTLVVAGGGEVVLDGPTSLTNAGRFVVMAGGRVTGADGAALNVTNGMPCYNAGTIEFDGLLDVNGSDFYNCGKLKVDVLRNTTAGGKLTNFGQMEVRTNMNAGDAYNCKVVNGCYMHYTGDAGMGNLTLLDNSRVDVGGKLLTTGTFTLYNQSEVSVTDLQMQRTRFVAPTGNGQFAVLQVKGNLWAGEGGDFDPSGNLYVDWANSSQGMYVNSAWSTTDNQWSVLGIIKGKIACMVAEATSPVMIPAGTCTGSGYHDDDDDDDDIPGGPAVWTFAFEDTFEGDYDMNDVVLQVKQNAADAEKIDVTLCCTGATLNLYVNLRVRDTGSYGGYRDIAMFNGKEVHAAMGQTAGVFVNTGRDRENFVWNVEPVTFTFTKPTADFDIATADFWVKSPQGDIHVGTTYGSGSAPYGLVIPRVWRWPEEWNTITGNSVKDSPYPDFAGFAADRTVNVTWYDHVVEGLVY